MSGTPTLAPSPAGITAIAEPSLQHYFVTTCVGERMCMDYVFAICMLQKKRTGTYTMINIYNICCSLLTTGVTVTLMGEYKKVFCVRSCT